MKKMLTACAVVALIGAAPALAAENTTNNSTNNMSNSAPSSGPGIKGAPGNKNGPAVQPNDASGNSGASTGEKGQGMSPSQDATGVKGAQDSTNGPSNKKPGDDLSK